MIRPATLADVDALVTMGVCFWADSPYAKLITVREESLRETASFLITSPAHTLLVADVDGALVGMLGLFSFCHPLSGARTVSEVFWWVSPAARGRIGLRLLQDGQQWAREQGATLMQVGAPSADIELLYRRLGFVQAEVVYQKSLVPVSLIVPEEVLS